MRFECALQHHSIAEPEVCHFDSSGYVFALQVLRRRRQGRLPSATPRSWHTTGLLCKVMRMVCHWALTQRYSAELTWQSQEDGEDMRQPHYIVA